MLLRNIQIICWVSRIYVANIWIIKEWSIVGKVICMNSWKETDHFGNIADYCQLYCQSVKNSCAYNSCDSDIYNKCDRP